MRLNFLNFLLAEAAIRAGSWLIYLAAGLSIVFLITIICIFEGKDKK